MTKRFSWWCVIAVIGMPLVLGSTAFGQDVQDRDRWGGGEGNWDDDNWFDDVDELSLPPSPVDADRWALVQSGNVIVDGDISTSGLDVSGGAVQINDGASLTIDIVDQAFSVGQTRITGNGSVNILGSGKFMTARDASSSGTIHLDTPSSSFETGGDFTTTGTLAISVTDSGVSTVKVGGEANVRGVIAPTFTGVNPSFGDSYEFISGASSVTVGKATVELPAGVTVGLGLDVRVEPTANSAAIVFGNLPVLEVNRATGASRIHNAVGDPITMTGYNITSKLGLLNPDGLAGQKSRGAAGWEAPNPKTDAIAEVNLTGESTIALNESIALGNAYNGGATKPDDEDLVFQFSTPDNEIINGLVNYIGPANEFVANINPDTGEISLYNLSAFIGDVEVTGYQVTSASGSLDAANFTGIGEEGWVIANPKDTSLSELSLEGSKVFSNPTVVSLGNIFKTDGTADIAVQYTTVDSILNARVEYGDVPGPSMPNFLEADFNQDGIVNFSDFLVLSTQFNQTVDPPGSPPDINGNGIVDFPDFLVLSTQFNMTSGGAAAVPEPSSMILLGFGGLLLGLVRRRRGSMTA